MTATCLNPMPYVDQRTVLLTSYKRDGTPVGTPVHIAVEGGRIYFRSFEKAWKTKRIRREPRIEIAPSTVRGEPTGPAVAAQARILDGEEARAAARAIWRKYPILHRWLIPWSHKLMRTRTVHFEVLDRDEPFAASTVPPKTLAGREREHPVPEPAGIAGNR